MRLPAEVTYLKYILMAIIISPPLGEMVKEEAREYKENLLGCVK